MSRQQQQHTRRRRVGSAVQTDVYNHPATAGPIAMMPYEKKALSADKKLSYSGRLMREFTSQLNMTVPLKVQRDYIRAMEGISDPATAVIKEILT